MKYIALLAVLTLLQVGCGGTTSTSSTTQPGTTSPPATTSTTTTPSTTTQATTTTTTTGTPTTTQATTTTTAVTPNGPFTVAKYGFFPDPFTGSDEAHGSGCTPGAAQLPDGIWFGFVEGETSDTLVFDLACFWTGTAAAERATEDGEEVFDFYIRNENPDTRTLQRDPAGTAYWLDASGDLTPKAIPMSDWPVTTGSPYQECPGDNCAAWVYINGGVVTELVEQYLP